MFALALACTTIEPAGDSRAEPAADSGEESELAVGTLDIERGSCDALLDPWVATTASEALDTWVALSAKLSAFSGVTLIANQGDDACPAITTEDSDELFHATISGDCVASTGWEFFGSATLDIDRRADAETSYHLVYDQFGADFPHAPDQLHFRVLGEYITTEGTRIDASWDFAASGSEAAPTYIGNVAVSAVMHADGPPGSGAGYVRTLASELGTLGDYCFEADYPLMSSCGPAGTVTLTGATTAQITWGEEPCGCHEVLLDGVDAGQACE